jgi:two-component SAPR family response regulator
MTQHSTPNLISIINNDLFVFKKLIFILPKNSDIKQSINNRSRNILFLLIKNKINDIIFFSINGINNTPDIIGVGKETKKINFYNVINNVIFKINIFLFLIKIIY